MNLKYSDLKCMEWLLGKWRGVSGKGIYHEEWVSDTQGDLKGTAYMSRDGNDSEEESLRLHIIDSEIYYTADVSHNPDPVNFRMTFRSDTKFVFENPDHDFPKKIIYEAFGNDELLATVESETGGILHKIEYRLKRILN